MHTHHKSSDPVATIGLDIGKNTFHLVRGAAFLTRNGPGWLSVRQQHFRAGNSRGYRASSASSLQRITEKSAAEPFDGGAPGRSHQAFGYAGRTLRAPERPTHRLGTAT
jgi:hypothetical protein